MQRAHSSAPSSKDDSSNKAKDELRAMLDASAQEGLWENAAVAVSTGGRRSFEAFWGTIDEQSPEAQPTSSSSVFDVDRMTTGIATMSLLVLLVQSGRIGLHERVSRYIEGFGIYGKSAITVRDLLAHTSGLPPSGQLVETYDGLPNVKQNSLLKSRSTADLFFRRLSQLELRTKPGASQAPSDLNFLLLGRLIEIVTGLSLIRASSKMVFRPLGMRQTGYVDLGLLNGGRLQVVPGIIVSTGRCDWRTRDLQGEVRERVSWLMGGSSGLAGVYASLSDILLFAEECHRGYRGGSPLFHQESLRAFLDASEPLPDGNRLGWYPIGRLFDVDAQGRNIIATFGETGCLLILDLDKGSSMVFLSNLSASGKPSKKTQSFFSDFSNAVMQVL